MADLSQKLEPGLHSGHSQMLSLENVEVRFGPVVAVGDVSLSVGRGEFVTLLGPSGCGKSTLLRAIAGYVFPNGGKIRLGGTDVTRASPQSRGIGMVFQNYALFPHMSAADNIGFGLRIRRKPRRFIRERVEAMLELVRLSGLGARRPHELSGGQQQRVALARALAFEPRLLLLDEPLAALDLHMRESMQIEIKRIQRETGVTTIFVTHDQGEALSMSDRIAVMNRGCIEQIGAPREIYGAPRTAFVADFVGRSNLLEVTVVDAGAGQVEVRIDGAGAPIRLARAGLGDVAVGRSLLSIRQEAVGLSRSRRVSSILEASVESVLYVGTHQVLVLELSGGKTIAARDQQEWNVGDRAFLEVAPERMQFLPRPKDR